MHTSRLQNMKQIFTSFFGEQELSGFIAPGRIEICGNHTDHQNGHVIAAAVDLYAYAVAAKRSDYTVNIHSKGFSSISIDLRNLSIHVEEQFTSSAFIRGIAAFFANHKIMVTGFDAYIESDIPIGSGLSSSASFCLLLASICNFFFANDTLAPAALANACLYAESEYFGKPSGLMDQTICATGGLAKIDFADPTNPVVTPLQFDFNAHGYALYIVDTNSDHANLTSLYATIPQEMGQIATYFDKAVLRDCLVEDFLNHALILRERFGDRSLLRAMHFFHEQERVALLKEAFAANDVYGILSIINASGTSSAMYLQNIYNAACIKHQPLSLALALSAQVLQNQGAYRVHGGGFAGTILAIVPHSLEDIYTRTMQQVFGKDCALPLQVSSFGAQHLNI